MGDGYPAQVKLGMHGRDGRDTRSIPAMRKKSQLANNYGSCYSLGGPSPGLRLGLTRAAVQASPPHLSKFSSVQVRAVRRTKTHAFLF